MSFSELHLTVGLKFDTQILTLTYMSKTGFGCSCQGLDKQDIDKLDIVVRD